MIRSLYTRWMELNYQAPAGQSEFCWKQVEEAYMQPQRHYHTLRHLSALFRWYDQFHHRLIHKEAVQLAIFFHDVVYRPGRTDNETKSAEMAAEALAKVNWKEGVIALVTEFIVATKDHHAAHADNNDLNYFLDFDLGVLASEPSVYAAYVKNVRKEYSYLDDAMFGAGRTFFIQKMLHLPAIFYTGEFRPMEGQARANLNRELKERLWHL